MVKKILGQENVGQKMIWLQNKICPNLILDKNVILGPKLILGLKIILGSKNVLPKKMG